VPLIDATVITYAVEEADGKPYLLARLRWPDVAEAISPHQTEWKTNRRLFDMLYSSDGAIVSAEEAGRLAASWGARFR
jgi:hypothetical protein